MAVSRSPIFDSVDPRLVNLLNQVGGAYGPYGMRLVSGYRPPGGQGGQGYHPKGRAVDVELYDKKTGQALKNYQDPQTAAAYQQFANAAYQAADPELQKQLRWGGYFREGGPGSYGALDLMHFDTGGLETPMAGGSWAGGFNPEQAKLWNMQAGGGIGGQQQGAQQGPPMPAAPQDYTPEQRRNAIAAIESAGSGDYNALGQLISRKGGAGPGVTDRAYGRYQIMGSNIPQWTQQALGKSMSPQEFLADPKAQDAVFDSIFGDYVKKYGEQGAASMWFTGRPDAPNAKDALGTTGQDYMSRYMAGLGKPGATGAAYPAQQQGPAAPGMPQKPTDRPASAIEQASASLGDISDKLMSGAGSDGYKGIPNVQMAKPQAYFTDPAEALTLNPQAVQAQRERLAVAMQRLNSGKLWVG
jgi:hypothetical protein